MSQSAWCGCGSQTVPAASGVAREIPVAIEFTVILDDTLGTLARLGAALGDAGVNVEAIQGTTGNGTGVVQFVANEPERAARALEAARIAYTRREVIIITVLDEPGTLGDVALVMAKAGINIDSVYVTTRGHAVLGVDDVVGATQVAGGMAVMTAE